MFDLAQKIVTYWMAAYGVLYMIQRPSTFFEALAIGPGLSPAAMAYSRKHYKLIYPLLVGIVILLAITIAHVQSLRS
jgi:hypothetical protein